jgi:hypothetical protein
MLKSHEELTKIIEASLEAGKRGDKEEEARLLMEIPLAPDVALAAFKLYGKDYLLTTGFDLSAANERFGEGWLDG